MACLSLFTLYKTSLCNCINIQERAVVVINCMRSTSCCSLDSILASKYTFVATQVRCFYSVVQELDIIELEKRYWYLKAGTKTGKFDFETFRPHVSSCISDALAEGTVYQYMYIPNVTVTKKALKFLVIRIQLK